jgi:hypothetical protein
MNRFNARLVLSVLLVSVIASAEGSEKTAPSKTPDRAFQVKVSNGALSVDARDAPLAKVFEEIGKQAGIVVEGNIGSAETVTARLNNVPLEEGIKLLSNNVTIHYEDKPNQKGKRITKIIVLSEDKRKVPQSEDAKAEKSRKTAEPARRPEPFKFEFDPTQSIRK